ncbi:dihydroorotase [Solitalea canadensis]|uniref:Dihydroorotase, multifunctional complex type n=1 Tax=Solitalea canadensis (strain ATCC 29591 / DSM 3403 / JCM 21819 / LMG 8368 / NBRC 15130 / NCIMB 12057 / USAM 9D) TaxID=929556 RepID=H8KV47_SOLCM|nr:dihydroorotase [Solitalea canadensis]AFD06047.1 dihydroorotase, multifunctional complex type [Solitalea canadensis DSM 3403]
MKFLIKSATIVDPNSSFNGQVKDILIDNGQITQIDDQIDAKDAQLYDATGQFVSPGWMDMHVNIGDPGYETKEDIASGCAAAAAGGFTAIAVMPNTNPPLHSKSEIEYLKNRSKGQAVNVYPIGCLSAKREGVDIAELFDMTQSGAVAFSDGNKPVQNAGLMMRSLQYALAFNGLVISYPEDASIAEKAKVNEGVTATYLGMKGIPNMAEELMVARDIFLTEYTGGKIHFTTISAAGSVDLIRAARKKGLKVTADVAAHHLMLDETVLTGFDSNYKVKPPLRTLTDIKALKAGLKDGTIDTVVSQHTPHEIEFKDQEFETAAFGISALETSFALFNMSCEKVLSLEEMVDALAVSPREILGLAVPSIELNRAAELTVFDPDHQWTLNTENIKSKSKNTPFIGKQLKGKALAIVNNGQVVLN